MKKKSIKTALSFLILFAIVFSILPQTAQAVTQKEIDALKEARDEIAAQKKEKQAIVDQLEEEQAGALERKLAMDERNMYTLQQLQNISEEIALYDAMIEEKAAEVEEALRLEDEQLERYRSRVRAMEENGNLGFLALVLNTSNLGELLTRIDDIGDIMESDKQMEDEYIAAREYTEHIKAEYEAVREDLDGRKAELREEQAQLEREIEEATELIRQLEEDIANNQAEYDELQAAWDEASAQIEEMVAELERQRREEEERRRQEQLASQGGGSSSGGSSSGGGSSVVGTGNFRWPVSCTYITSRYGMRWHPVTGGYKSHTGMDIGSAQGDPIYAADGGTVTLASVNGGYGNCIMIDHGNGYQTLYGHLSGYAVSAGQTVSKGDLIGYVGATGVVTGPHLHFEIWVNGSRTDPENYFSTSSFTFAPDAGD